MNLASRRIRKRRAPQRPLPAEDPHHTPLMSRRRSSRIGSRQLSVSIPQIQRSYSESHSPFEERPTDPRTSRPVGATPCTSDPVEVSPSAPLGEQSREEYPGVSQTNSHQIRKRGPDKSIEASAARTSKRARLTKENLRVFEKMAGRTKIGPKSKSSRSEQNSSCSRALSKISATTGSTSKTVPTTDSSFPRLAFENGILDPGYSAPHENLASHQDQLDRARDTASPSQSEYKAFAHRIRRAPNEMSMVCEIFSLLKRHEPGYGRAYNHAFNDFPKNVGFNNGLSATQPDMIEGLESTQFDPFPVRQELGGAAVPTPELDPLILPHLAGEWKGPGKYMILAETQAAYDGACMVYARNEARSFLNRPDPTRHAYVRTFTTDGTTLNTYAHYASESEGQVKYHQVPTSSTFLIYSYEDFKKSRRHLRNLQDNAKETSEKLRDELKEKWLAIHRSSVTPTVPAETADPTDNNTYDFDDEEDPSNQLLAEYRTSLPTNDQDESAVENPALSYAIFPANDEDDPSIQVSNANNGCTSPNSLKFPLFTPPHQRRGIAST